MKPVDEILSEAFTDSTTENELSSHHALMVRARKWMETYREIDLKQFDVILANTSGGKDSQAMLAHLMDLVDDQGVRDRLTLVHCDLGRIEWPGTKALAIRLR